MGVRFASIAVLGLIAGLTVSGCGSGSSEGGSNRSPARGAERSASSPFGQTVVSTAATRKPKLGAKVLVDSQGFTLYAFSRDPRRTAHPRCMRICAWVWPPLILRGGVPVGSSGAIASQLGVIERSDGKRQVDYGGAPLYRFRGDDKPGDALGNGDRSFGGVWHALTARARPVSP
jgi:predicted lipoprotein with Yx(FWY)xxD motif